MIGRIVRLIAYCSIGSAFVELVRSAQALLEYDRENSAEFLAKIEPESEPAPVDDPHGVGYVPCAGCSGLYRNGWPPVHNSCRDALTGDEDALDR